MGREGQGSDFHGARLSPIAVAGTVVTSHGSNNNVFLKNYVTLISHFE